MEKLRKYYEILGIKSDASIDEIHQAYRDMVSVWHPDKFVHDPRLQAKATEMMRDINKAYEKIRAFFEEYGPPYFEPNKFEWASESNKKGEDAKSELNISSTDRSNSNTSNSNDANIKSDDDFEAQQWLYYSTAIGNNSVYYYEAIMKLLKRESTWNWPAYFFGVAWALYRKMYNVAIVYAIILVASNLMIYYVFNKHWISIILGQIAPLVFAKEANSHYEVHITNLIESHKQYYKGDALIDILKRKGGVNVWVPWVFGVIAALSCLVMLPLFLDILFKK